MGGGLTGPWDTRASLGAYLRRAQQAGIQRTVLLVRAKWGRSEFHNADLMSVSDAPCELTY